jgi:hypothetical protein
MSAILRFILPDQSLRQSTIVASRARSTGKVSRAFILMQVQGGRLEAPSQKVLQGGCVISYTLAYGPRSHRGLGVGLLELGAVGVIPVYHRAEVGGKLKQQSRALNHLRRLTLFLAKEPVALWFTQPCIYNYNNPLNGLPRSKTEKLDRWLTSLRLRLRSAVADEFTARCSTHRPARASATTARRIYMRWTRRGLNLVCPPTPTNIDAGSGFATHLSYGLNTWCDSGAGDDSDRHTLCLWAARLRSLWCEPGREVGRGAFDHCGNRPQMQVARVSWPITSSNISHEKAGGWT